MAQVALLIGFVGFLAIVVLLLLPSIMHTRPPMFSPRVVGIAVPLGLGTALDTVTIDAGAENRWRYFDFERGLVADPPDTAGWDVAFERFHVIPSGEIANLGKAGFDTVRLAPATGYVRTTFGRDTSNVATARWYSYSYLSHLLVPRGDVYVLRTKDGHVVKLQILGYYCAGPTPGCLTFRYGWLSETGAGLPRPQRAHGDGE